MKTELRKGELFRSLPQCQTATGSQMATSLRTGELFRSLPQGKQVSGSLTQNLIFQCLTRPPAASPKAICIEYRPTAHGLETLQQAKFTSEVIQNAQAE